MDLKVVFKKIEPAFEQYYNIKTENVEPPFFCEAEFTSQTQQYFLVKAAKISEAVSNEFVYFAKEDILTKSTLSNLAEQAWNRGLSKVTPGFGHRNSVVKLIILTNYIEQNLEKKIKKTRLYKSYKWTFYGWSHFKLAVICTGQKDVYTNSMGKELKKLLNTLLGYKNLIKDSGGNSK